MDLIPKSKVKNFTSSMVDCKHTPNFEELEVVWDEFRKRWIVGVKK